MSLSCPSHNSRRVFVLPKPLSRNKAGSYRGLCDVGILTLRQDLRQRWTIRSTPTLFKKTIVELFLPLPRVIPPRTPTTKSGCACCSSCIWLHPALLCSCSCSLTIFYGQMILGVLLCQHRVVLPLLDFQPTRLYLLTWLKWLMVLCIVSESFSREALRGRVALHQQRRAFGLSDSTRYLFTILSLAVDVF